MNTAVHVALGSDLVILGMSMDDAYLRLVLMQHRRWLGEIFWIDESFKHEEWARVAHVTMVRAPHREIWRGLADAFVGQDKSNKFCKIRVKARSKLKTEFCAVVEFSQSFETAYSAKVKAEVDTGKYPVQYLPQLVEHFIDVGLEIPAWLQAGCAAAPSTNVE